jgi:hypothetical protein
MMAALSASFCRCFLFVKGEPPDSFFLFDMEKEGQESFRSLLVKSPVPTCMNVCKFHLCGMQLFNEGGKATQPQDRRTAKFLVVSNANANPERGAKKKHQLVFIQCP